MTEHSRPLSLGPAFPLRMLSCAPDPFSSRGPSLASLCPAPSSLPSPFKVKYKEQAVPFPTMSASQLHFRELQCYFKRDVPHETLDSETGGKVNVSLKGCLASLVRLRACLQITSYVINSAFLTCTPSGITSARFLPAFLTLTEDLA